MHWNFPNQRPERILKHLCRSAILRQHLNILHISQNFVNVFAGPREISNPATCSMKLQVLWWWNGKFHRIRGCECYSSLPILVDYISLSRTEFVGVGYVLETQLRLQLARGGELLTVLTGSNQSCNVSKKKCTSRFSVITFSRRWIPLPFSSVKAFLYPKRWRTAHTLDA